MKGALTRFERGSRPHILYSIAYFAFTLLLVAQALAFSLHASTLPVGNRRLMFSGVAWVCAVLAFICAAAAYAHYLERKPNDEDT